MTDSDNHPMLLRIVSIVRAYGVIGIVLAAPALAVTWFLSPSSVGYVLIATAVTILYVSAQRVNEYERGGSTLDDVSDDKVGIVLSVLLLMTFTAMTGQLLAVTALAELLTVLSGSALFGILAAIVLPVADRLAGDWWGYLSIGGAISLLAFRVSIFVIQWHQSRDSYGDPISNEISGHRTLY